MNTIVIGQVVYSKNGRDGGGCFVVVKVDGEYVYLVDGALRTLQKPKKKKQKHVQMTHTVLYEIAKKIVAADRSLLDANIRKALMPYRRA